MLFVSRYRSGRLICPIPDGKKETIILQELVHLPGSNNHISQSQIMDTDIKVEPVDHYGLNLYNRHGKLITTAPQVDRLFILDRVLNLTPESTEYTDIDNNNNSSLLALTTTEHGSRHNAEMQMSWHRRLAHIGLKASEMLLTITGAQKMTGK
jgi:hypothetical protein